MTYRFEEDDAVSTYSVVSETPTYSDIKRKGTYHLRAIEASAIPEALVSVMADHVLNFEIVGHIVQAVSALSIYAPLAIKIGNLGALKDLIVIICSLHSFRDPLINVCIECIWNILEHCGDDCLDTLAREELIIAIRDTVSKLVAGGYKLADRKLRNELMILVCEVSASAVTTDYFLSKEEKPQCFLEELIRYSSHDEINLAVQLTATGTAPPIKPMWGTEPEDLELKKLLWSTVTRVLEAEEALEIVRNSDFIPAILVYIDPTQRNYAISRWQEPQLKEIQSHALKVLGRIVKLLPEHFQQQNGNYCLVNYLSANNDCERKVAVLKVLEVAASIPEFKLELAEEGIFDLLYDIVLSEADYPLSLRELVLSTVSNLCGNSRENQKEFRRKGWIELLTKNIKQLPPAVIGEPEEFLLAVLDCLWHAVLQNKRSKLQFIDAEGVTVLLDYLDICPEVHRRLTVSCLSACLKVQHAQHSFLNWNSHNSMDNAAQLMIRLYEEEEKRLNIIYDKDGVLIDPKRPLSYTESRSKGFERLRAALEAAEFTEVNALKFKQIDFVRKRDFRACIYCLLSQVGFDVSDLKPRERQRMEIVRMYPEFRKGELLLDIHQELNTLGVKPIADDRVWLDDRLREAEELAQNTAKNQSIIARDFKRTEEDNLATFYKTVLLASEK